MSITSNGVKFGRYRKGRIFLAILGIIEMSFSVLLVVALSADLLFPQRTDAVAGVSANLSYQGRLTDLSGNPLGGATGTNYCFRFSIYDAATAGVKQWPAGTPNSTTVQVKDGVFNSAIGTADSLSTFDFSATSPLYLNVEVNATPTTCSGSWETLDVRQRIDAVGYARVAEGVYSSILRAPTGGTAVQIGTGGGLSTPIFLNLDVKNVDERIDSSCSTNGQMWYNSFSSRARVCVGSVIRDVVDGIMVKDEGTNQGRASTALDFTGAGVSASKGAGGVININVPFAGIAANGATISSGSVVFSNANGVSFGFNGSTITASVNAGGAGNTFSSTNFGNARGLAQGSVSLGQNSVYFFPEVLQDAVAGSIIKMPVMVTNSSSAFAAHTRGYTAEFGVYSRNATNSTVLTRFYSTSYTASFSASSNVRWNIGIATGIGNSTSYNTLTASSGGLNLSLSVHGPREIIMPFNSTLTAGQYWFAFRNSSSTAGAAGNLFNLSYLIASSQTQNRLGNSTNATNIGIGRNIGLGTYSVTSGALPAGVSMTQINMAATNPIIYFLTDTS